jgi:transposase
MNREVIFTMKEGTRYGVIKGLLKGRMTNREASQCLGLSCRQIKRIKKRVQREGAEGVIHGNKGRRPSGSFPDALRKKVIQLAQNKYLGFNFSHLSEWLAEKESITVSRETVRKWLRSEGLGKKLKKTKKHRKRRQRSEYEGQMLFLDGSPHLWFGDIKTTLILATDDATGAPLWGTFRDNEDLDGCFIVCKEVFKRYGLPTCFYLDRASQFTTTRHKGLHVQQDDTGQTQFERAMEELSVGLIFADSPQARGRGERINGSFQGRLVAELSFYAIKTRKGKRGQVYTFDISRLSGLFSFFGLSG